MMKEEIKAVLLYTSTLIKGAFSFAVVAFFMLPALVKIGAFRVVNNKGPQVQGVHDK